MKLRSYDNDAEAVINLALMEAVKHIIYREDLFFHILNLAMCKELYNHFGYFFRHYVSMSEENNLYSLTKQRCG